VPNIPNFPQNLSDLHHAWHTPGGAHGLPPRAIPFGQPGSGLEFFTFHRTYIAQFHAWYDVQPDADQAAVAAWTAIPAELKDPAVTGWDGTRQVQEQRIVSNNPPFADADDLGQYVEGGIHGWLHGAAAAAYGESILNTFHSPQSTYFWQLHGLVDHWWTQFQPPKSLIKDVIDSKGHQKAEIKEIEKVRVKEAIKEHIKEAIKERPEKPQFKEWKEIKEKDIFEGGFEEIERGDPAPFGPVLSELAQRLQILEGQVARGQAFIRPEERPDVGGHGGGGS
jgi:hypothetical protein